MAENTLLRQENLRLNHSLLDTIKLSLSILEEWNDVSRKLLYPHQHNTASKNKVAIGELSATLEKLKDVQKATILKYDPECLDTLYKSLVNRQSP